MPLPFGIRTLRAVSRFVWIETRNGAGRADREMTKAPTATHASSNNTRSRQGKVDDWASLFTKDEHRRERGVAPWSKAQRRVSQRRGFVGLEVSVP